jgi:hypothetical protein
VFDPQKRHVLAGAIGSAFGCYLDSALSIDRDAFLAYRKVSGSSPL